MKKIYEEEQEVQNTDATGKDNLPKSYGDDVKKQALKLLKNIRFIMKSGVINTAFSMPEAPQKMEFLLKDANMPKQFTNGKTDAEGERPMYRQPKEVVDETKDIAERLFSKFDIKKFYEYLNESTDPYLDEMVYGYMLNEEFEFDSDAQSLEMLIRDYVQASATAVCTMIGRVTGQQPKELLDTLNDWATYTDPEIEQYVENQKRRDLSNSKGGDARAENLSSYYKYATYIVYLKLLASTHDRSARGATSNISVDEVNSDLKKEQIERSLNEFRSGKLNNTKTIREQLKNIRSRIMTGVNVGNDNAEWELAKAAGTTYTALPEECTYVKETEGDETIDADKIFNQVKTSITKTMNAALVSDPGTWATVKLFEQSGNELIKAATEEITTRIKVICNVDKSKKLTPKVPLQQSGLINLWKRYEQELVRRQHDRINQFGTSGSVEFFKDFMGVTVPNVFSAMIVFRNVVYGLQHSVNPESLKQLEDILGGYAEQLRKLNEKDFKNDNGDLKNSAKIKVKLPIEYKPNKVSEWTKAFGLAVNTFNDFYKAHNEDSQEKLLNQFAEQMNQMWEKVSKVASMPEIQLPQVPSGGQAQTNESLMYGIDPKRLFEVDDSTEFNFDYGDDNGDDSENDPLAGHNLDDPEADQREHQQNQEQEKKEKKPGQIDFMYEYMKQWMNILNGLGQNNQEEGQQQGNGGEQGEQQQQDPSTGQKKGLWQKLNPFNRNKNQQQNQQANNPNGQQLESLEYEMGDFINEYYNNLDDEDILTEDVMDMYARIFEDNQIPQPAPNNNAPTSANNQGQPAQGNNPPVSPQGNQGNQTPQPNNAGNGGQEPPQDPNTNQQQEPQQKPGDKPFEKKSPEWVAIRQMYIASKQFKDASDARAQQNPEGEDPDRKQKTGSTGSNTQEPVNDSVVYYYKGNRIRL